MLSKLNLYFFILNNIFLDYDKISIKFNGLKLIPVDLMGFYLNLDTTHQSKHVYRYIYYDIFYSHLSYACNIWGLTSEENLKKVEIVQKKPLKFFNFF